MLTCNLPRFTLCLIQAKYKALTGQDPPAAGAKPAAKAEPAKVEAPKAVDAPKATAAPAASAPAAAAPVSGVTAEAFAVLTQFSGDRHCFLSRSVSILMPFYGSRSESGSYHKLDLSKYQ